MLLQLPQRCIHFPRRPLVMGIVNANDDSFANDGSLQAEELWRQVCQQISAGADVIDIGAESARTNRTAIPVAEECRRLRLILPQWQRLWQSCVPRDEQQLWPPLLSVNTWRAPVVELALQQGAELINDLSALRDATHARLCAEHGAALLIMHSVGEPKQPHFHQQWPDVMAELEAFFEEKVALACAAGLTPAHLVLDPGIDFAKQREDNLRIYRELARLQRWGCPVLVPVSRKTVIGEVLNLPNPRDRDAGTLACIAASMAQGAQVFRVHHVDAAWQAVKMLHAIQG